MMSTFYLEMHYVQGHYNPILKVHCMKNEPDRAKGREYVKTIIFVTLNFLYVMVRIRILHTSMI